MSKVKPINNDWFPLLILIDMILVGIDINWFKTLYTIKGESILLAIKLTIWLKYGFIQWFNRFIEWLGTDTDTP